MPCPLLPLRKQHEQRHRQARKEDPGDEDEVVPNEEGFGAEEDGADDVVDLLEGETVAVAVDPGLKRWSDDAGSADVQDDPTDLQREKIDEYPSRTWSSQARKLTRKYEMNFGVKMVMTDSNANVSASCAR